MKPCDIQSHFDKNQVRNIGSGSHARVYATQKLVVKSLHGDSRWQDPVRACYQLGKERLGGFVVPFQQIDEVTYRIREGLLPFFPPKITIQKPIVQLRIPEEDRFQHRFSSAIDRGAKGEIDDLVDAYIHAISEVYRRGLVLDMDQRNFVVGSDMTMRSIDLGAMHNDPQGLIPQQIVEILLDGLNFHKSDELKGPLSDTINRILTPEWLAGNFSKLSKHIEPVADIEI